MSTLVLTAIGDDRPGLVDALSGAITAHGGSWEESRMARLGGKFAGIVAVELPEHQVAGLRAALAEIEGLRITVDGAGDEPAPGGAGQWLDFLVKQVGKTTLRKLVDEAVGVVERHYIEAALALAGGNRTVAAELLGLSRQSLYVKLNRYGLDGGEEKGEAKGT